MELYCNEYRCDDFGVTCEDRFGAETIVCRHPILPISRMVNVDTGETKLEIAFKRGSIWKSVVYPKDVLANSQKIIELARQGVAVDSENAKSLVKYITCLEAENYDKLGEVNSVGRLGWIHDYGFSPYVDGLRYDGDLSFKQMYDSVRSCGSREKWLEIMRTIRTHGVIARIMIAASFSSALVEPLGGLPFFVHAWGGTEAGKTVGLMAAASVWANPTMGSYIHTFNSTSVGQEMSAGFVNSLPLCIDELQVIKDRKEFDNIIYMLTEGIGRSRGAKTGGLQKLQTWKNCILSTGEQPISSTNSGGGAVNRIIEIDCKDEKLFSDPHLVANTVRRNYGFAGEEFVQKLSDNMEEAKELYTSFYKQLASGESTEKQAMAGAMILTADQLSDRWIFADGRTLCISDIEQYLSTKDDVNQNERALEWLYDLVAANPAKFGGVENYSGDIWGEIDFDRFYVIKSVFDRQLIDAGYSPSAFLSWAKQSGILYTESGRLTKNKRIKGTKINARCVCLQMDMEDEKQNYDELPL
ncbi:MAG: DUF927 domain-containing protein [Clostridiales bacterium]|nr:DUF927 domain-containing protein [Clostridiales bacterium]